MPVGTVIIISHNSAGHVESCLRSVGNQPDWDVVVVDNASRDETVDIARHVAPHVRILANAENRGFAAGVNQAAALAEGKVFLVLNPDTTATGAALLSIAKAFADEKVGAAGGMLTTPAGAPERGFTVRRLPTLASAFAEVLLLNRAWPDNPLNRSYRCLDFDHSRAQEVEQPAGACLAIRRETFEDMGGFDENFFPVWFEDVDFCRRASDRGWKIVYCPDAVFVHAGGHSVTQIPFQQRQAYWYRNLLLYFAKHHSRWELGCLRAGVLMGLLLRSLLAAAGLRPRGVSLKQAVAAYLSVIWNYALTGRGLRASVSPSIIRSAAV